MVPKLSAILQYSTMDYRFLKMNLEQLSKCCDEIIIPICDHFFNGEPEDQELLEKTFDLIRQTPNCSGYIFEWQGHNPNTAYYHNLSRYIGTEKSKGEWLLFVDGDEIVDDNFKSWFNSTAQHTDTIYWLTCYWYFREPVYQSTSFEGCGLLMKRSKCNWNINIRAERQQFHHGPDFIHGGHNYILSDDKPMMHHFSWVRTKEEMLLKVTNWGHKNDTDWVSLVDEEFSRPFNGSDFIHKYQYNIVPNKFNV